MIEERNITDYFPFETINSGNLNFPEAVLDPEDQPYGAQRVATSPFRTFGVKGLILLYPIMPEYVVRIPMGEVRYIESNSGGQGKREVIETPLGIGIAVNILSREDYQAMYHTKALVILGSETFALDCIDRDCYEDGEEITLLESENLRLKDFEGKEEITAIPGRPDPLQRIRVQFVNAQIEQIAEDYQRRLPRSL